MIDLGQPSTQMRCMITASRRARMAFFIPRAKFDVNDPSRTLPPAS